MKVIMTLLARDEADIVDAQIAYHLHAGVDFVIATDNLSEDSTTEILERYEREGRLHLIREPGDDLRQSEWVTRMAQLAATEFEADWVLNADADEFWWPTRAGLKDVLSSVPEHFGVVRGAWRNFVPRPCADGSFAERMTARLCTPSFHPHPLSTHSKSAHRAVSDVRIGRGNHEAFGTGLRPVRGWYPLEILHFPVRSLEQCMRKYVTQFVALERNAQKGIPGHMAEAYEYYRAGRLEDFYRPLVVDDAALARGLESGDLAVDTRLRDLLRTLGFGAAAEGAAQRVTDESRIAEIALFAAECAALLESDYGLALSNRIDDFESRLDRLDRRLASRAGRAVRGALAR
jgi:Glycosyl transferase family 2